MYDSRKVQRQRLAELIERSGMSLQQISRASNVKTLTLRNWLNHGISGGGVHQIDAVRRVSRVLGTTVSRLLDV